MVLIGPYTLHYFHFKEFEKYSNVYFKFFFKESTKFVYYGSTVQNRDIQQNQIPQSLGQFVSYLGWQSLSKIIKILNSGSVVHDRNLQ